MSMESANTAIAVIDVAANFPAARYNILIPTKTITQISPFHRVSINVVQLDSNPDAGDVYTLQGKLAPTKNGIMKLAGAAGIQVKGIRSVTPAGCERCVQAAALAKAPPSCRDCPNKDDICMEAEVLLPDGAGGYRSIIASREWNAEDERAAAAGNERLYAQAKRFRKAVAESKALLRAVRSALSVKAVYTAAELKKPFVVPVVTLNYDDPALREAVVRRLASGVDAVFGAAEPVTALPRGNDATEDNAFEDGGAATPEIMDDRDDGFAAFGDDPAINDGLDMHIDECHECGAAIEGFTSKQGKAWSAENWAKFSVKQYGAQLCPRCAYARRQKEEAVA
jgi:hypothetical protein